MERGCQDCIRLKKTWKAKSEKEPYLVLTPRLHYHYSCSASADYEVTVVRDFTLGTLYENHLSKVTKSLSSRRHQSLTVFVMLSREGLGKPDGLSPHREEARVICEKIVKPLEYEERPNVFFIQVM